MSTPHVGWPVAADDDQATPGAGLPADTGRSSAVRRGRPLRAAGSASESGPAAGRAGRAGDQARTAVSILADRLAAALVHHEPGWRLPRHSALARRYSVSPAEIDAAVGNSPTSAWCFAGWPMVRFTGPVRPST